MVPCSAGSLSAIVVFHIVARVGSLSGNSCVSHSCESFGSVCVCVCMRACVYVHADMCVHSRACDSHMNYTVL